MRPNVSIWWDIISLTAFHRGNDAAILLSRVTKRGATTQTTHTNETLQGYREKIFWLQGNQESSLFIDFIRIAIRCIFNIFLNCSFVNTLYLISWSNKKLIIFAGLNMKLIFLIVLNEKLGRIMRELLLDNTNISLLMLGTLL